MAIIITAVIAGAAGTAAGWKLHRAAERDELNRKFRKSVRIAARMHNTNYKPHKVFTAGDDYGR